MFRGYIYGNGSSTNDGDTSMISTSQSVRAAWGYVFDHKKVRLSNVYGVGRVEDYIRDEKRRKAFHGLERYRINKAKYENERLPE